MGVSKVTYVGACLKVKGFTYMDELQDELMTTNGWMMSPKDKVYYLIPNKADISAFGIRDSKYDDERAIILENSTLEQWRYNFKEQYKSEIQMVVDKYPEATVVVAFVTGIG